MVKSCLLLLVLASPVCVSGLARKGDGEAGWVAPQKSGDATGSFDVVFKVALRGLASRKGQWGNFTVRVHPDWAPLGAARFKELVEQGFYDDISVFRVVKGFVAQFGLPAKPRPELQRIKDDNVTHPNVRGTITFATSGPNSRTSQLFINYGDNHFLNSRGFAPFGEVIEHGMDVVDSFFMGYGEKPSQQRVKAEGNAYLAGAFPQMTKIMRVFVKEAQCLPVAEGTACYKLVTWAREQGVKEHPGWYPGLTAGSSREDFQAFLHNDKPDVCPTPCAAARKEAGQGGAVGSAPHRRKDEEVITR